MEKVIFGAGCFWAVEVTFRLIQGVSEAICGYSGGHVKDPTYSNVCTGKTGHAEVVQVEYDPDQVTYKALLDVFWNCHNPTTRNQQGLDVGSQYRSVIFFCTTEQEVTARSSMEELRLIRRWSEPIVTEILPASKFYRAEEYHQKYMERRSLMKNYDTE
ncbi:MAG: peptide-methionine (S)-S-oxide reductase MsrA [Nitrosomonadales bacterium]|nr:MAG: peptide-methionine (S)-S-oxide reductase MsrA [Nitrosomonadales bacterium]